MSATNVARAGKRGNIFVSNNVSARMCPRLPVPLEKTVPFKIPQTTQLVCMKLRVLHIIKIQLQDISLF